MFSSISLSPIGEPLKSFEKLRRIFLVLKFEISYHKLNISLEHLILYVNPGEVFYCSCDYSPPVPIWIGSVNEDLSYNEQKVSGHSYIPPPPLPSSILPPMSPTIQPLNSIFSSLHNNRTTPNSNTTSIAALFTGGHHYSPNLIGYFYV